ncbi:tryptophan--tRNA ligase [Isoptericola sp. S6320L]|uniref:tryptophan--tRNA ligase n=1 Tax=Isoptericola sp. S6320L TaxID=2926411 RepID=UPI001FF3FAD5|nr:tryptophan--tRNA ligase [Isoptericola sp. S6320L]MCK0117212.1 tryptophan--tRNA ligase [Isoptericola sp. S6320L]
MTSTTAPVPEADGETASVRAARTRSAEIEQRIARDPSMFRVLTGDRPTGALHLGHYLGTLANRVRLQDAGVDVIVVVADYQVITDRDETGDLPANVREVVLDYLAAGIDPRRTTVFAHSAVAALHQLMLPFLSLVTVAELERNPTVKAESVDAATRQGRSMSGLLLTYPVHQAADILAVHGNLVPVGTDQLPHLETSRTVARRFNQRYTAAQPYFAEPEALLADMPTVLGNDGAKMSTSRGNALELRADEDETAVYLRRARTDSHRHITFEPGSRPEVASLLRLGAHFAGTTPEALADTIGADGAGRLKEVVTEVVVEGLRPIRARRRDLAADGRAVVGEVLARGAARATVLGEGTLADVRELMGTVYS